MRGYVIKSIKIISFLLIFLFSINSRNFKTVGIVTSTSNELNKTFYKSSSDEIVSAFSDITTRNTLGGSELYRDRISYIEANFTVFIAGNYSVKINNSYTYDFDASITQSGSNIKVKLTPISGADITPGSYKISLVNSVGTSFGDATFDVLKYYNNYNVSASLINGNGHANEENTWKINFDNIAGKIGELINSNNFSNFSVSIRNVNGGPELVGSKFTVDKNGSITIKNNFINYPTPGTYTVTVTHTANDYEPKSFNATTQITVKNRNINLGANTNESYRYIVSQKEFPYLEIKRMFEETDATDTTKKVSKVTYYPLDDSQKRLSLVTEKVSDFTKKYPTADLNSIPLSGDGYTIFDYTVSSSVSLKITNYDETNITYILGADTYTDTVENFETKYPGVITQLKNTYTFDTDGKLLKVLKEVRNVSELSSISQIIFASSGGEFTFTFKNYSGVNESELKNVLSKATITSNDGVCSSSDGTLCNSKNDKFDLSCSIANEVDTSGNVTTKGFICHVKYSNTLEKYGNGNKNKDSSLYHINLNFADADPKQIDFSLYDQAIDYYLTSEYDKHVGEKDELINLTLPPANMRYNYYLGLYLVKGGMKQDTLSDDPITTRIFDRHVEYVNEEGLVTTDLANAELRYYDVATFQIKIKKYIDDKVTFDLWLNDVSQGEKTMSTAEFLATYKIDDRYPSCGTTDPNYLKCYGYNADGTINDTSPFKSDSFIDASVKNTPKIDILKFYPKGDDQYIKFVENKKTTRDYTLEKFKATYPEMYYLLITKLIF